MRNAILKNQAIYFGINLLVMLLLLIFNYSPVNIVVFLVVAGLSLLFSTLHSKTNESACVFLPVLLFLDILLYFALNAPAFQEHFSFELVYTISSLVVFMVIAGVGLTIFGLKVSRRWIVWVGSLFLGVAFISANEADRTLDLLASPSFQVLLALHVLLATLWFFCVQISDRAAPNDKYTSTVHRNSCLTVILLCLLTATNLLEREWIISLLPQWKRLIYDLPANVLVWWKLMIAVLVFSVCAVALCEFKDKSVGTDAYVMFSFVGAILLAIVLQACFFPLKWLVLLVYAQMVITPIKIFMKGYTQFRLSCEKYLVAVLLLSILEAVFLQYSLWLNLLVTMVVAMAVYHLSEAELRKQHSRILWSAVILSIAAECAGLLMVNRQHTANFIILVLATVIALATMFILNTPHPAGKRSSLILEGAVCVSFALICTVMVFRHGTRIDLRYSEPAAQIELDAIPNGKDNTIVSLQFSWSELGQKEPAAATDLCGRHEVLAVEGNKLTIEAVDRYGVRTTRTVWFLWH